MCIAVAYGRSSVISGLTDDLQRTAEHAVFALLLHGLRWHSLFAHLTVAPVLHVPVATAGLGHDCPEAT